MIKLPKFSDKKSSCFMYMGFCSLILAVYFEFSNDKISSQHQLLIPEDFSSKGTSNNSILSQQSFNTSDITYSFSNTLVVHVE